MHLKHGFQRKQPVPLFIIIIIFLCYQHFVGCQTSQPTCAIYTPKIPQSLSMAGNCRQETGNVSGTLNPNQIFPRLLEDIESQGYFVSTHNFVSEDGYIQAVYRISGGIKSPPRRGKQSILLFHGLGGGSVSWVIQPGGRNLGFMLADAGYEVWLGNCRGTSPSLNHTNLDPNTDLEYWNFSFHEMGTRDLPLIVELMLWITGNEKVYYGCHSLGCALYLAGLSELPELSDKFKAGFLLAPATFLGRGDNPFFRTIQAAVIRTPLEDIVIRVLNGRMSGEPNALLSSLGLTPDRICAWSALRCGVCDNALFAFYGADAPQLNYTDFPNLLRKLQDNFAIKSFFHIIQDWDTCQFRKYDYGGERNIIQYGSADPPPYQVGNVRVPTYIFYGESDNLVSPPDAENLWNNIQPRYRKGFYRVDWPLFNHVDFLTAKDADVLIYNRILDTMNKIELEERYSQKHYNTFDFRWSMVE